MGLARHQLGNLRRWLRGQPLAAPALGSMTLERDDVARARALLRGRAYGANDPAVVAGYEERFAAWNGSRHAFAFASGRVALGAALRALALAPGDEVVVPGYTCVVVANAIRFEGLVPRFADIELDTYGPDVERVAAAVGPRTRAIVLQHLYGLVCRDYEALLALARERGLAVVEDCAHATGAVWRGQRVGTRGDLAIYSSEQSKVFTTGQGGLAVTDDPALAERLASVRDAAPWPAPERVRRQLRTLVLQYYQASDPGRWWKGDIAELAHGRHRLLSTTPEEERGERPADHGARMPSCVAELGLHQLPKIERFNAQRRETAERWTAWCKRAGYAPPKVLPDSTPVFLRFPVLVEPERKADLRWAFDELGVEPGVWFTSQLHPAAGELPGCPRAATAVARCINLPCLGVPGGGPEEP